MVNSAVCFDKGGKSSSVTASQRRRDHYVQAWDMEQEDDFSCTSIVSPAPTVYHAIKLLIRLVY